MFILINNPVALVIILCGGFAVGITLLCLMLKLVKQEPKTAVRIIGAWMVIYTFMFLVVPMLSEAFWRWSFLGEPINRLINTAITYPFFYRPGIVDQCSTPIFPIELFFYCLWIGYFVSGIAILRLKSWGRSLAIYATEIGIIFSFGLFVYSGICLDFISSLGFMHTRPSINNYYTLSSLIENVLIIGFPALIFWILLSQDNIKPVFEKK